METTPFYDVFKRLCDERNVSPSYVVSQIGLAKPNATFWKKGSVPKFETVKKLANYFSVPVSEFATEDDAKWFGDDEGALQTSYEVVNEDDMETRINEILLNYFRELSDDDLWEMIKRFYKFYSRRQKIELYRYARDMAEVHFVGDHEK